jgi:hypothetical protein
VPKECNLRRDPKTLAILPSAGDDASDAVRLALSVRNAASVSGRCACGAVASSPVEVAPGVFSVTFEHEHDCPAAAPEFERAARGGQIR